MDCIECVGRDSFVGEYEIERDAGVSRGAPTKIIPSIGCS
jgi:hypothetical protein